MNDRPARYPFHVLTKPIGPLCNLACEYCFYLDKTGLFPSDERYRMTDGTLEEFTRQYIAGQPADAREVNFAWQGGEPTLMGLDFFRRAVELQQQHARPGLRITNALQTNGTLFDDAWGEFLHQHGFLVGMSVDGPEELHDHYRRDRRGAGSFARVMAGIEILRRHRVEFNTLTVVQHHNGDHGARVYDFLKKIGSTFMQFIPIVVPTGHGEVSEASVRPSQFGGFLNAVFDRWRQRDIGRVYVQHFELMLGIAAGYPPSLCVHSETCGRSVALEHNGDLYSCDHFVFPEYRLGSVFEQSLADMVDGPKQVAFGLDKQRKLPACCRECAYLRYCHGACPSDRICHTGDGQRCLNYLCEGYKAFYAHSHPYFAAMAECLRNSRPASDYRQFMGRRPPVAARSPGAPSRNAPCPCGSGRKYKRCCGRQR